MTVIVLDSGAKFEVREGKLFLKKDYEHAEIENIERLIEILNGSESVDVIFKLDLEATYFKIERRIQRIDDEEKEEYIVEEYPVFVILLLHEFKRIKLSIEETSYILVPLRKFKEKEILDVVNNAPCAWLAIGCLYSLGRLMDYFTDSEIFVKNRLEGDFFKDFQTRLKESKTRLEKLKSGNSVSEYSELVTPIVDKEEILDFFLELAETLNKVEELSESKISKISIFSEFLERSERLIKDFLMLTIHVISRLVLGKKLISLQLFSILMDTTGVLMCETIRLTARNIFDVDNLFKLEQDQRKSLLHLTSKWGEAKEFKRLRNVSPLSHRFKPIDLSGYTAEKIAEILLSHHNFLTNLLYDNIKLIKKRVESEEDEKLQREIALIGVSTDDVLDYIYQLEDILSAISKFTPPKAVVSLKYLRNLYLNLFLLLSFFEEVK